MSLHCRRAIQALPPNSGSSISYPGAPGCTVLRRFITEKFFDVLNMGKGHSTAQMSALLGGNMATSMEAHQRQPRPGTTTSAGGPQGDSPAGGVGPGLGRAQAEEVFQAAIGEAPSDADRPPTEYSPTTPATSAGEPLGDLPAGEAGGSRRASITATF